MPFHYLRQQREAETRLRARTGGEDAGVSMRRAVRVVLVGMVLVPLALYLPWIHSSFGPSGMPDFWVRAGGTRPLCSTVTHAGQALRYCEDVEAIPGTDWALISCDSNRRRWNTVMGPLLDAAPRGQLYAYQYPTSANATRRQAVEVELIGFPHDREFHPLGVSMLETEATSESKTLFVVNHARERSTIEVLQLHPHREGWRAEWVRSIVHVLATHTPNSIHALTQTTLVVTNDHLVARRPGPVSTHLVPLLHHLVFGSYDPQDSGISTWLLTRLAHLVSHPRISSLGAQIETILGLPGGWVSYVDFDPAQDGVEGVRATLLARGIPFANGLTLSPDGKTLAVASTTYPGIWFYRLHPPPLRGDTKLRLQTKLHLPFRVDNLGLSHPTVHSASTDGWGGRHLLATGHAAPLELMRMAKDPSKRAPSWTVAIRPFASQDAGVWEDREAPLPAHRFMLSHNPAWSIRTTLQSSAKNNSTPAIASSAAASYHADNENTGTLIVSGLYDSVLACTNVSP